MMQEQSSEMTAEQTVASAQTAAPEGVDAAPLSEEQAMIAQLRADLAAAQAKADENWDKLQRSAAEFQNSRRRLEAQLGDAVERANAGLIGRLLPVLDDLDLAFQNVPADLQAAEGDEATATQVAWLHGFRQIRKKLVDLLTDQGVVVIDSSGQFDPNRHEAISSEPHEAIPSGHIIAEVRAGYEHKGRVLRPALVRVAM